MKLLRLKSTPSVDLTSQFTVNWASPIEIKPGASIALKSLAIKGVDSQFVKITDPIVFSVQISATDEARLVTIPAGKYSKTAFISTLTTALNKTMNIQVDNAASAAGFEWRAAYSSLDRINISFNRVESNTSATFIQSENITKPQNNQYKRNSGTGNDAYIVSTLPSNRGNAEFRFNIIDGADTSVFIAGWVSAQYKSTTLDVSNYILGVGINPSDNKLYTVVNGAYGAKIGAGFDCSQFTGASFYNANGTMKARVLNGTDILADVNIVANVNLYANSFTAVTLNTSDITFEWAAYYETPYAVLNNNTVLEIVDVPDNVVVSNVNAGQSSKVSLNLLAYPYGSYALGFIQSNYSVTASTSTFKGNYQIQFVTLEDVLVELLSMSFLESYDTEVGYKRPIIYSFDTLNADAYDNIFNAVDYPLFISLKNNNTLALSSMTVRISSGDQVFNASGGVAMTLIIDDGV